MVSLRRTTFVVIAALTSAALPMAAMAEEKLSSDDARAIAVEAYVYFYPLITMDITRKVSTNVEVGKQIGKGPMNVFVNVPEYPPANYRDVVRPNFDTLYSVAWVD